MNNSKYLAAFFEEISLPSEAADAAYAVEAALFADEISLTLCEKIKESFFDSSVSGSAIQNEIRKIAENLLLSQYILAFYLLSSATEKLKVTQKCVRNWVVREQTLLK